MNLSKFGGILRRTVGFHENQRCNQYLGNGEHEGNLKLASKTSLGQDFIGSVGYKMDHERHEEKMKAWIHCKY
jgi:hypothetical protein